MVKKMDLAIIDSIRYMIDDAEMLLNTSHDQLPCEELKMNLRILKTFVLCARKLHIHGSLAPLLLRIKTILHGKTEELSTCWPQKYRTETSWFHMARGFGEFMESLVEEMNIWYVTMLDCAPQSSSLSTNEVLEIINSDLEILMDCQSMELYYSRGPVAEGIEPLREKMIFLKSLIHFVKEESDEASEDLLAHVETMAISAAYIMFQCKVGRANFDRGSWESIQPEISELVQKMKPVDPQVLEVYTEALRRSKLSRQMFDDDAFVAMKNFLDSLISNLWEILRNDTSHALSKKDQLQELYEGLRSLRAILKQQTAANFDMRIQQKFFDVISDAGISICSLYHARIDPDLGLQQLLGTLRTVLAKTGESNPKLERASFDSIMDDIAKTKDGSSKTYCCHMPSQTALSTSNEVIGLYNEEKLVLNRLQRGSQQLRIIVVGGMPGVGKTTLARKVFNHPSVQHHFSVKAWCPISQVLDKDKVLLDLLAQIDPNVSSETQMMGADLTDELRRSLKGKRYLIFLDDIWTTEAWDSLRQSFPNDTKGSRIIFTSRSLDVAPSEMLDQEPLILSPLSKEQSLELVKWKLFHGKGNGTPPELYDLGMQIAEKCKGLPLAIVIVSGLLATIEQKIWAKILDGFNFVSSADYYRYTLEFSYNHLPDYLKPCFLYFGTFSEDHEVPVRRLLRLWIAEGFVQKSETKSQEDVAEDYLKMLIGRSLIMVARHRYDGGVKTCRIHDLLRDFCLQKAKDEQFFHFLKGRGELLSFNEPCKLRRLCIDSEAEHFKESKLYCLRVRTLLLRCTKQSQAYRGMSSMLYFSKLLRVLNLEQYNVGSTFPSEIEQLVHLAFLAIRGWNLSIPSSIANLSNLETFYIRETGHACLFLDSLWKVQKLQHLYMRRGGMLPLDDLDSPYVLDELDRLSGANIRWCSFEKLLRKFPNIRKLKCKLFEFWDDTEIQDKFVFPDFLSRLESLVMSVYQKLDIDVRFDFSSLTNLKKLTLSGFRLHWDIFSVIGQELPDLEVLKLADLRFKGEEEYVWDMKGGEFSKLKIMNLIRMPIRRWRACDDHEFECFQMLVIHGCDELEELPSCLESIETLEMVEVYKCPEIVVGLVRKIEEEQNNWGNSGIKITFGRSWEY